MTTIDSPVPAPSRKPASLMVFGILNLVFGVLGLCSYACGSLMLVPNPDLQQDPFYELIHQSPSYQAFLVVSMGLGSVASIVLIAAGIGLLAAANWGRVLSIVYSLYALAMGIVGIAVNIMFLVVPLMEKGDPSDPAFGTAIGGAVGGTCGGAIGMAYPIVLLIFMTRPHIKQAVKPPDVFARERSSPPQPWEQ